MVCIVHIRHDLRVDRPDPADAQLWGCEMATKSRWSALLGEFARTLLTDFPIQGILDKLVVRITGVLPVWSARIALISAADARRHVAASDDSAWRFVKLQTELAEGPCLTAHRTGHAVVFPGLQTENDHFPGFARRALGEGCGAVFPLADDHHRLGALDLSDRVGSALAEPFVPSGSMSRVDTRQTTERR